jgi:hypothetical protein
MKVTITAIAMTPSETPIPTPIFVALLIDDAESDAGTAVLEGEGSPANVVDEEVDSIVLNGVIDEASLDISLVLLVNILELLGSGCPIVAARVIRLVLAQQVSGFIRPQQNVPSLSQGVSCAPLVEVPPTT